MSRSRGDCGECRRRTRDRRSVGKGGRGVVSSPARRSRRWRTSIDRSISTDTARVGERLHPSRRERRQSEGRTMDGTRRSTGLHAWGAGQTRRRRRRGGAGRRSSTTGASSVLWRGVSSWCVPLLQSLQYFELTLLDDTLQAIAVLAVAGWAIWYFGTQYHKQGS